MSKADITIQRWSDLQELARKALTEQWESVPELRERTGISGLVFASLNLAGRADRRIDYSPSDLANPSAHVYYRINETNCKD